MKRDDAYQRREGYTQSITNSDKATIAP